MVSKEQMCTLLMEASKAADKAYAPYSNFRVGAALLCEDGVIVTGVNVENRSFGLTVCAERNAINTGVTMGNRRFLALAIFTPDSADPIGPCGACRQVLSEFMPPEAPVSFKGNGSSQIDTTIGELMPWDSLHGLKRS